MKSYVPVCDLNLNPNTSPTFNVSMYPKLTINGCAVERDVKYDIDLLTTVPLLNIAKNNSLLALFIEKLTLYSSQSDFTNHSSTNTVSQRKSTQTLPAVKRPCTLSTIYRTGWPGRNSIRRRLDYCF